MTKTEKKTMERLGRLSVDVSQLATLLSVSKGTIRKWMRKNRLPSTDGSTGNRRTMWKLSDIMGWMSGKDSMISFYESRRADRAEV